MLYFIILIFLDFFFFFNALPDIDIFLNIYTHIHKKDYLIIMDNMCPSPPTSEFP